MRGEEARVEGVGLEDQGYRFLECISIIVFLTLMIILHNMYVDILYNMLQGDP